MLAVSGLQNPVRGARARPLQGCGASALDFNASLLRGLASRWAVGRMRSKVTVDADALRALDPQARAASLADVRLLHLRLACVARYSPQPEEQWGEQLAHIAVQRWAAWSAACRSR
jgi:hypothetical protein